MSQSRAVVEILKKSAKRQGITYRDLARKMGKSEVTVKRIFAERRLTLERLEEICKILGLTLNEATELASRESRAERDRFTIEQERALASDPKFFALYYLVTTHLTFDDILERFQFEKSELTRYLVKMDRLGFIDLLPGHKFKPKVAIDQLWIENGPLMKRYGGRMKSEFVDDTFGKPGEYFDMRTGYLSESSLKLVTNGLNQVLNDIKQLSDVDEASEKRARRVTFMVACRPFNLSYVSEFLRASRT